MSGRDYTWLILSRTLCFMNNCGKYNQALYYRYSFLWVKIWVKIMSDVEKNEQIVWTPQMPDRRKNDRRARNRDFYTTGKMLNVSDLKNNNNRGSTDDRRRGDRRKKVSVTITGRAIEVEQEPGRGK